MESVKDNQKDGGVGWIILHNEESREMNQSTFGQLKWAIFEK